MTGHHSIREQVLREIRSRLDASESPSANAFRARLDQIEQADLPCYDIEPGEQSVGTGDFGDHESVTVTLPITVRAIVDAAVSELAEEDDEDPLVIDDSSLDPFYVYAVQQLVGHCGNLGGLVDEVSEVSAANVYRPEGRDMLGLEMKFEVKFAVRRGDPTQRG